MLVIGFGESGLEVGRLGFGIELEAGFEGARCSTGFELVEAVGLLGGPAIDDDVDEGSGAEVAACGFADPGLVAQDEDEDGAREVGGFSGALGGEDGGSAHEPSDEGAVAAGDGAGGVLEFLGEGGDGIGGPGQGLAMGAQLGPGLGRGLDGLRLVWGAGRAAADAAGGSGHASRSWIAAAVSSGSARWPSRRASMRARMAKISSSRNEFSRRSSASWLSERPEARAASPSLVRSSAVARSAIVARLAWPSGSGGRPRARVIARLPSRPGHTP